MHARTVSLYGVLVICAVLVFQHLMCIITNTHTDTHALHWSKQDKLCVSLKQQMMYHTHTDTHAFHIRLSMRVHQQMIYHRNRCCTIIWNVRSLHGASCMCNRVGWSGAKDPIVTSSSEWNFRIQFTRRVTPTQTRRVRVALIVSGYCVDIVLDLFNGLRIITVKPLIFGHVRWVEPGL